MGLWGLLRYEQNNHWEPGQLFDPSVGIIKNTHPESYHLRSNPDPDREHWAGIQLYVSLTSTCYIHSPIVYTWKRGTSTILTMGGKNTEDWYNEDLLAPKTWPI